MVSSIGGFGFGLSQFLFPYIIWKCVHARRSASGNASGNARIGLEWELPSPAPYHSWVEPPSMAIIDQRRRRRT